MSTQPVTGTSEVSKKLKAAIRAKLEELGVYVDDELPDYIMVMIANKKERVQMKEDLNLFIGKSTAKFVDWLFDLFDRLQNASNKQGESSSGAKKDEEKQKEQEAKELEEKHRKEKEEKERELQKEKEKERERQRERDRAKRVEEEKRREEKRKEASKPKRRRTRSRSNTYSDDERMIQKPTDVRRHGQGRSVDRKRPSAISSGDESPSPVKKLQSKVTVHRNIRPTGEPSSAVKGRGTMFMRALNEASVSSSGRRKNSQNHNDDDDDMSDVEALPSKAEVKPPKKSVHERLSRVKNSGTEEDDTVVLGNQPKTGGPQMILKLSGGREAIKKARIQDRIVLPDDGGLRRGLLKRRVEMPGASSEEPKAKHERIKFDASRDTTPSDGSPTMQKWNGHIRIGDDSDEEDDIDEAQIDAMVAEARGIPRRNSAMEEEEEIPATHHLSGAGYPIVMTDGYPSTIPTYIPTPLSVLNEQHNQMGKDQQTRERCVFWPKCTKKEACPFAHPTTNCKNFPNCTYGTRCLFIHPNCRFDRFCTKKHCPFTHPGTGGYQPGAGAPPTAAPEASLTSNRFPVAAPAAAAGVEEAHPQKPLVRGALGSLAEKLAASIKKKPVAVSEEKTDENEAGSPVKDDSEVSPSAKEVASNPPARAFPDVAPLQNLIPCRYAGRCHNPVCHFKHPKECRFGSQCRNPSCYFYHKPAGAPATTAPAPTSTTTITAPSDAAGAKYKWTASATN